MKRALEICGDFGGSWDEASLSGGEDAGSGAKCWRDKFLRGPYLREHAIARGVMRGDKRQSRGSASRSCAST